MNSSAAIRPLYQMEAGALKTYPAKGHAGLWLDKYCNVWQKSGSFKGGAEWSLASPSKTEESGKAFWLRTVLGKEIGSATQSRAMTQRYWALSARQGGRSAVYKTHGRFVTGIGRPNPTENGFAWHPTLGTPYLPGSSLKGLVRAFAREDGAEEAEVDAIFGGPGEVGRVAFLDVIPTTSIRVELDLMTPHYGNWTPEDLPGDWRSPNIIPFLAVADDQPFVFTILPLKGADKGMLDRVEQWLAGALKWLGAGAKGAVGYGRFQRDQKVEESLARKQADQDKAAEKATRLAEATGPEAKYLPEILGIEETELLRLIQRNLGKALLESPEERQAFAQAVCRSRKDLVDEWKKGRTKDSGANYSKKKLKEYIKWLKNAAG